MTTNTNIDYIATNFRHAALTKIVGTPNYDTLKVIKEELMENAGSVPCDLGGGNNGHLGLVLTPQEYANVSATAYTRPVHPGHALPVGDTNWETTVLREAHKENLRVFREAVGVEEALIKQLSNALPSVYLKQHYNTHSKKITTPLVDILTDLFATYGVLSDEELQDKETQLRSRVFDIKQPLLGLYEAVNDLQELATASGMPYSDRQLVSIGLHLIKNMNDYDVCRGKWLNKAVAERTWANFQRHFTDGYHYLLRLRGPTMENTDFQQANYITQQVLAAVQSERAADKEEIFSTVKETEQTLLSALNSIPGLQSDSGSSSSSSSGSESISEITDPIEKANYSANDKIQLEMLKILQKMDSKLDKCFSTKIKQA